MPSVDFEFISREEGGQHLNGYVPAASQSKSGVTIATGFDLGARNEADLTRIKLSKPLIEKLKPYLGKQSTTAKNFLKENPLSVTKAEADEIDKASKSEALDAVRNRYNAAIAAGAKTFGQLPSEAQTVIASVAFQYGQLRTQTPKFWALVLAQDWTKVEAELRDFGDAYKSRRNREADLLKKLRAKEEGTGMPGSDLFQAAYDTARPLIDAIFGR